MWGDLVFGLTSHIILRQGDCESPCLPIISFLLYMSDKNIALVACVFYVTFLSSLPWVGEGKANAPVEDVECSQCDECTFLVERRNILSSKYYDRGDYLLKQSS